MLGAYLLTRDQHQKVSGLGRGQVWGRMPGEGRSGMCSCHMHGSATVHPAVCLQQAARRHLPTCPQDVPSILSPCHSARRSACCISCTTNRRVSTPRRRKWRWAAPSRTAQQAQQAQQVRRAAVAAPLQRAPAAAAVLRAAQAARQQRHDAAQFAQFRMHPFGALLAWPSEAGSTFVTEADGSMC